MTDRADNRPERCGAMRSALSYLAICADAVGDNYTRADMLITAVKELANQARGALAEDDRLVAADDAAFQAHIAEPAHDCGTPADGAPDPSTYPARMTVLQRDPADPESWVFRCGEDHAAECPGWQSPDYASEDDALIAAGDHARAMHDMALPAALAERAAAAERTFAGQ